MCVEQWLDAGQKALAAKVRFHDIYVSALRLPFQVAPRIQNSHGKLPTRLFKQQDDSYSAA